MSFINVEIKAHCNNHAELEQLLLDHQARYIGEDHQIDTYFKVPKGRLKLREGNIENSLLHYHRPNTEEAKTSTIAYYKTNPNQDLKDVLLGALEELVIVDKKRKIFFIDNVKFHLDEVKGLGTFMEIEAIDQEGTIGEAKLQEQCAYYIELLGIKQGDFIAVSYSDLLLGQNKDKWLKLINSNKQEDLQSALMLARNIAPDIQNELAFWLILNTNLKVQRKLYSCLNEEYQELVVLDTSLIFLDTTKCYQALAHTNDFIAKKIICNLQNQEGAFFQQKVQFVNEYMEAANCSMEAAQELYKELTSPKKYSEEVERWTQLAASTDLINRELALQTAGAIKEQLQAPLLSLLFRQKNLNYRLEIFDLLTTENQELVEQVLGNKNLIPLHENKSYQYFVRTDDPIAQKVILKLEHLGKAAYTHKILFVKEYRALTGLGLRECKEVMDEVLKPI